MKLPGRLDDEVGELSDSSSSGGSSSGSESSDSSSDSESPPKKKGKPVNFTCYINLYKSTVQFA